MINKHARVFASRRCLGITIARTPGNAGKALTPELHSGSQSMGRCRMEHSSIAIHGRVGLNFTKCFTRYLID